MRILAVLILFSCLFLLINTAFADEMSELKEQVKTLTQAVQGLKSTVESQQKEINSLKETSSQSAALPDKTVPSTVVAPASPLASTPPAGAATQEQIKEVNAKVNKVIEAQKKSLPGEFNPAIGVVGETLFSYRTRGSAATGSDRPGGFDIFQRSVELNVAASVDPFATGYAVINASADPITGEANLEVEEAAAQTTSLPWNLTLKGGRFFGEFGRLAYIHDHELPVVNRPLVLDRYIGGESQTDGAQVSWLLPIEHYVNFTAGLGDKFGDPQNNPGVFRGGKELNYFGRLSTYFDLTPDWQVETGVSGLIDPRTVDRGGALVQPDGSTLSEKERRLAGMDFSLRYVPLRDNQFRSFTWGNEVLFSGNRYLSDPDAIPDSGDEFSKSVNSTGLYSYLAYKIDREWTTGLLFDFLENEQNMRDRTYAYSAYLTYAISHWNQLRLQYTHTDHNAISDLRDDDAVYLQWTWIIGSHSHGWQQR